MMTPKEKFNQALKASIKGPYDALVSFSIDSNGVTLLRLQADLLRDETMFSNLLNTLRTDLPTNSLQVSLQPHKDYDVEERFTTLQDSLQDIEGLQITRIPYKNGNRLGSFLLKAGAVGAGVIIAPFAVTAGVAALGFTSAGIAAGSVAAGIMSSYGGTVAAGSFCAVMQSVGAAGLGAAGTTIASTAGGVIVGGVGKLISSLSKSKSDDDKGEKAQSNDKKSKSGADEEDKIQPNGDKSKSNDNGEESDSDLELD